MSLIENLTGRKPPLAAPATNQIAEVAARLKAAESELARLEAEFDQQALDLVLAGSDVAPVNRRLSEARQNVTTMLAALKGARDREAAELQRHRISLQQTQIRALGQHCAARNAAAVKLVAAIKDMADQYKKLVDHSLKARAAGEAVGRAIGVQWPTDGSISTDTALKDLLAHEFYRASATPGDKDGRALVGSRYPGMEFEWNPQGITPLDERVKKSSAEVMAMFKAPE